MSTGLMAGIRFPISAEARTGGALNRVKGQLSGIKGALASVNDQARRAGRAMQSVGRGMSLAVTAPIVGAGAYVLKASGDFEAGMNRVQALSGAAEADFRSLKRQAMDLGSTTKFSATQAADAMGFLAMAGFKADQIMGAMPSTLQLAAAANMDLGTSADIVSNVLTGFKRDVEDLAEVNDVLVKAMTSSNTDLRMLGDAMKYVGPIASSAKLRFNEVTAALGLLGNAGIQGEMGGTALQGIISRLVKPTSEAAGVMEDLGVNVMNADGTLKDLAGIMDEFAPHAENTGALMEIFGQRAGPAMAALLGQGADSLRDFEKVLDDSGGTASRIAETQMKGLNGAVTEMKSAFEGLAIAIGESGLLEWVTAMVKGITGFVRWLSTLNPTVLKFGTILAGIAAVTGPVLVFFGLATIGITGMTAALGVLATAFWPITAVVAAVAGAAMVANYLVKNWDGTGGFFRALWADIKAVHVSGWQTLKAEAEKYSPETVRVIEEAWAGHATVMTSVWKSQTDGFKKAFGAIRDLARGEFSPANMILPQWDGLPTAIGLSFDGVKVTLAAKWEEIKLMVGQWPADFLQLGRDLIAGLQLGIEEKIEAVKASIGAAMESVIGIAKRVPQVQSPSRVFKSIGRFLMEGLQLGIDAGAPLAEAAMGKVSETITKPLGENGVGQVAGSVKQAFTSLFQSIVSGSGNAADAVKRLGQSLLSIVLEKSVFGLLSKLAPTIFGGDGTIPLVANANGNAFVGGRVQAFASGGVVSRPTLFGMHGGMGLMGEAGPEGILPLGRVGGKLGVYAGGSGRSSAPAVNIEFKVENAHPGAIVGQRRERGPDGREMIVATVSQAEAEGEFDRGRQSRYGQRPKVGRFG